VQDELSLWRFLGFLATWQHAIAFAVMGAPVVAGHRWGFGRKAMPLGDSN
jgi:hypothetical protein